MEDEIEWVSVDSINQGKAYKPSDGVTADDMNKIIQNMRYLRMHAGRVTLVVEGASVTGSTLQLTAGGI